jgi:hypothetical protein
MYTMPAPVLAAPQDKKFPLPPAAGRRTPWDFGFTLDSGAVFDKTVALPAPSMSAKPCHVTT